MTLIKKNAVEVRRTNVQCGYGEWLPGDHEDVPMAVVDAVCDEIMESDEDSGEVTVGGQGWEWRRVGRIAMWTVEVDADGGWTTHSTHGSYRCAVDQSDTVHGRVLCPTGGTDEAAWQYATREQGYEGDYASWRSLDDDERASYESGAAGVGTV